MCFLDPLSQFDKVWHHENSSKLGVNWPMFFHHFVDKNGMVKLSTSKKGSPWTVLAPQHCRLQGANPRHPAAVGSGDELWRALCLWLRREFGGWMKRVGSQKSAKKKNPKFCLPLGITSVLKKDREHRVSVLSVFVWVMCCRFGILRIATSGPWSAGDFPSIVTAPKNRPGQCTGPFDCDEAWQNYGALDEQGEDG